MADHRSVVCRLLCAATSADPFTPCFLVRERLSGPFADDFSIPLRDRCHYIEHQPTRRRTGVGTLRHGNKRDVPPVKPVEQLAVGATVVSAAEAAGISRETVHRWNREDWAFQAAVNRARRAHLRL